jgi:adenylate cyclase
MTLKHKLLKSSFVVAVLIGCLSSLLVIFLRHGGYFESIELAARDWSLTFAPGISGMNSRIVEITINDDDIRNRGLWPLPDGILADAVAILTRYEARAIGIDIFRDIPVPPGSDILASTLAENPSVIAVMKYGSDGIAPPSILRDTEQVGFNDILVDSDGVVRRALLFLDDGGSVAYSFALRLALLYLKAEGVTPESDESHQDCIRLGQTTIRPLGTDDGGYVALDARGYQFLIDFEDRPDAFKSYSLTGLLSGEVDPGAIKGKIVLIGVTAQGVKDFFYTPYSRNLKANHQVPGLTLHGHIASQLVRFGLDESRPIKTFSWIYTELWILLWGLAGGAIGLLVRSPWRFSLTILCSLLTLCVIVCAALWGRLWVSLAHPAAGLLISAGITTAYMSNYERKQRAFLMQIFSRHVSREIAESIWTQREKFLDGGRPRSQKLVVTSLFTDLKGFTTVAEKMEAFALIDWLNEYMETMAQLVESHGGIVDDYAGDGIKANFGVPVARSTEREIKRDAVNAVNCALAMAERLRGLHSLWQDHNLPTPGMRIGINTGTVIAGTLGSAQRLKYTTVGNTVNIASRLESYDKEMFEASPGEITCRILISEATFRYVDDQFQIHRIGNLRLKGQDREVTVFSVIGRR